MGLIESWLRVMPGIGITGPFFGLTERGRRLAAVLLTERRHRRAGKTRVTPSTKRNTETEHASS
jgi:hypothetical protein